MKLSPTNVYYYWKLLDVLLGLHLTFVVFLEQHVAVERSRIRAWTLFSIFNNYTAENVAIVSLFHNMILVTS